MAGLLDLMNDFMREDRRREKKQDALELEWLAWDREQEQREIVELQQQQLQEEQLQEEEEQEQEQEHEKNKAAAAAEERAKILYWDERSSAAKKERLEDNWAAPLVSKKATGPLHWTWSRAPWLEPEPKMPGPDWDSDNWVVPDVVIN